MKKATADVSATATGASRAGTLRFSKMHGAGNDFVVLDLRGGTASPDAALCRALADRHTGIGCDQILTIEAPRSASAVASYRIWNADGSNARQCGNGARCVAAWLRRDGAGSGEEFVVDSPVGAHTVTHLGAHDSGVWRVAMGVPRFSPAEIPLHGFAEASEEYVVEADGTKYRFGAVSMGNPHAVIEVEDVDTAPVATVGPRLQSLPAFPDSANIGFAQVQSRSRVRLRVYERGVGETLACGSGACAAAAALMKRGRVDREVTIALPGGELQIAWPDAEATITMAGPTAFVFEGEWIA